MGGEALAQAKTYLRVAGDAEDAVIGGLVASALSLCEGFLGQVPIARTVTTTVPVSAGWQRLAVAPVRAITLVEGLAANGTAFALPAGAYAIDIDGHGEGWVRSGGVTGTARLRVTAEAGMAADWSGLPEGVRQGVVRLAAHLFAHRDGADDGGPPAAVAALWRSWRRMRLS